MKIKFFTINSIISLIIISIIIFPLNVVTNAATINTSSNKTTKYYISSDGDNNNDGSYFSPLKDLYGFKQKLINDINNNNVKENVNVIIRDGSYYFDKNLSFSKNNLKGEKININFTGLKNVTFTGGIDLDNTNYTTQSYNNRNYIVYDLSQYYIGFNYDYDSVYDGLQVSINNNSLNIARYPNEGYTTTSQLEDSPLTDEYLIPESCNLDLDSNDTHIYVSGYFINDYKFSTYKGTYKDNTIYIDDKTISNTSTNVKYYVLNSLKLLDIDSEYYIDYENNLLYLLDTPNIRSSIITLSLLDDSLITLNGLNNISFENISFTNCRNSAINLNSCSNIKFNNCAFNNISKDGVNLSNTSDSIIRLSKFINCGGCAIKSNNIDKSNNKIELNTIDNCCKVNKTESYPIMIIDNEVTIRNNKFNNISNASILLYGKNNLSENNIYTNINCESGNNNVIILGNIYNQNNNLGKNNLPK